MRLFKKLFVAIFALSFLIMFPFSSTFAAQVTGTGNNIPTTPLQPASSVDQCHDHVQDGDETGVDCGGKHCKPCNSNLNVNIVLPHLTTIPVTQWKNHWSFPNNRFQLPKVPKMTPLLIPGVTCDPTPPQDSHSGDTTPPTATPTSPNQYQYSCQNNLDGTVTETVTSTADGTKYSESYHPSCDRNGTISALKCDQGGVDWSESFCNPGYICYQDDDSSQAKCVPEKGKGQCMSYNDGEATLVVMTSDDNSIVFSGNSYCESEDGSDYVEEAVCNQSQNPNHISYRQTKCTNGTICIAGFCQQPKQPTCKDHGDGTISTSDKYGNSLMGIGTFCLDAKTLRVAYCNGNVEQESEESCSSDQICKNGACVAKLPPCPK